MAGSTRFRKGLIREEEKVAATDEGKMTPGSRGVCKKPSYTFRVYKSTRKKLRKLCRHQKSLTARVKSWGLRLWNRKGERTALHTCFLGGRISIERRIFDAGQRRLLGNRSSAGGEGGRINAARRVGTREEGGLLGTTGKAGFTSGTATSET